MKTHAKFIGTPTVLAEVLPVPILRCNGNFYHLLLCRSNPNAFDDQNLAWVFHREVLDFVEVKETVGREPRHRRIDFAFAMVLSRFLMSVGSANRAIAD